MTTELTETAPDRPAWLDDYAALSVDEMGQKIRDALRMTAEGLWEAARLLRAIEERGGEPERFFPTPGLYRYLRRVAYGQMLPEVIVEFSCSVDLISRIGKLPIPEQRRLTSPGGTVPVVVYEGGERTVKESLPVNLKPEQVSQVFGNGYIRPESEQHNRLLDGERRTQLERRQRIGDLDIDTGARGAFLGRRFIPYDHLVQAVNLLKRAD